MDDRVVVITGATGGLGKLVTQAYAEEGASLALISNNQKKLDSLSKELDLPENRIMTHNANLLDANMVLNAAKSVIAKYGHLDVLIHLVGGWIGGKTLKDTSVEEFALMINQHTWTTIHLLRAFSAKLAENGWGRVIVVSSPLATEPSARMGAYALGKAAQETLLLTLAEEFSGTDVTANIIQVKSIDTKGMGKGTSPAEIVAAMLYFCLDEAKKVNGLRLPLY